MKISFDFDSTLSEKWVQEIAKILIKDGNEVWVTTTRRNDDIILGVPYKNDDLYKVTDELGINRDQITFTCYDNKVEYLKDFDIHFDDDDVEIDLINRSKYKCHGILVNYKRYITDATR